MSPMGMERGAGTVSIPAGWGKVTVMAVRPGFPATALVNDTLVVDAAGNYALTWRGRFASNAGTQNFRVVRNGTDVLGTVATQTVGTVASVYLDLGDTLELQGNSETFGGVYRNVPSGSDTYVEITALSTNYTASATRSVTWGRSAELTVNHHPSISASRGIDWGVEAEIHAAFAYDVGAAQTVDWEVEAEIAVHHHPEADAEREIVWHTEADLWVHHHPEIAAARNIHWNVHAEMLHTQPRQNLNDTFDDVSVSVHTVDGRSLGAFTCRTLQSVTWGRELMEVSTATLEVSTEGDPEMIESLCPWLHWITIWHAERPMWTGPIQQLTIGSALTTINARDISTFMWRTRVPVTKTWTGTNPTLIAESLLETMLALHRISGPPLVLPGVTEAFTYHVDADSRMLHQAMDDLTKLGLNWTVVAGQFVLGDFDLAPFAELAECDFLVEIQRLRDGTGTFNDVRIQGQNYAQTAVAPLAGMRLQTLVSLDDIYGVSNIQKATQRYAAETAAIRDVLQVPAGASLHPEAPVTLLDLVPGRVLKVSASGLANLMRIDQMQFSITADSYDAQVTLVSVQDLSKDTELLQGGAGSGGVA